VLWYGIGKPLISVFDFIPQFNDDVHRVGKAIFDLNRQFDDNVKEIGKQIFDLILQLTLMKWAWGCLSLAIRRWLSIRSDVQDSFNDVCQTRFTTYHRHQLLFNSKDLNLNHVTSRNV
jgi:Fe-S cluster biosynthesis and repair protein YggX